MTMKLGDIATIIVSGDTFTGRVYYLGDTPGWATIETERGAIARGPVWGYISISA